LAAIDEAGQLDLRAAVLSPDGAQRLTSSNKGAPSQAVELGQQVARDLLSQGAAEFIDRSRRQI
jgi:porphobilinogen deaminase